MARSSSGIVAGLTAAALAAVGFLAYQASANVPESLGRPEQDSRSTAPRHPKEKADPKAVPADSGEGTRVVYALESDRVWLIGAGGKAKRTFEVMPSTVDPSPGEYSVTTRSGKVMGSDGVPVEHVVRFANVDGVTIGFSAATDGSTPKPDPMKQTGGIRESRADGQAMWEFATIGVKVVVVP
ncbi:hypothetical protein QIS99_05745 [Streptomyces sp. B-S-A8]|uniref:L,D-transpeptidase n=1 Tax=Streptomyces solicavernae TaxID=3043614 RepID=A0ABT6RMR8_9ACTN|nr:hypothetical protein [Streptomyces sp. B-S-A8]MDI3385722.1 hypothetical protein [Streptomyces sp. B-S-A8]